MPHEKTRREPEYNSIDVGHCVARRQLHQVGSAYCKTGGPPVSINVKMLRLGAEQDRCGAPEIDKRTNYTESYEKLVDAVVMSSEISAAGVQVGFK